jgi:hypothetical protein
VKLTPQTGCNSFEEALELAAVGDNEKGPILQNSVSAKTF